jgi:hypothetical protein
VAALGSPIRSVERVGVHGGRSLKSVLSLVSAWFEPGIIWLRFYDGTMPS